MFVNGECQMQSHADRTLSLRNSKINDYVHWQQAKLLRHFVFHLFSSLIYPSIFFLSERMKIVERVRNRGRAMYCVETELQHSRRTFIFHIMLKSYYWINKDMTYDPISSAKGKWLRFHFSIQFFGVFFLLFLHPIFSSCQYLHCTRESKRYRYNSVKELWLTWTQTYKCKMC